MKIILTILVVFAIAFAIYLMTNKVNSKAPQIAFDNLKSSTIDTPMGFGYKCMWIAVKTGNKERVAELLGLKDVHQASWKIGLDAAYADKVFITPKIGEWTLIAGYGLAGLNSKNELDEAVSYKQKIDKLSKEFGEAQFFATHRVTEYHAWARSINGQTVRFYSYVGEKGENILIEGNPTSVESHYNLINTFSSEAKDDKYFNREDLVIPDEDLVMKIAANWSIDPTTLEKRNDVEHSLGLVGQ